MRVKQKEDVYEAVQFLGENIEEVLELFPDVAEWSFHGDKHGITELNVTSLYRADDRIIRFGDYVVKWTPFSTKLLTPIIDVIPEHRFHDRYEEINE